MIVTPSYSNWTRSGVLMYYGLLRLQLDRKLFSSMMNFSLKHLYKVLSLEEKLLLFDLRG